MNQIEIAGKSDIGRKRTENQDCFLVERIVQQTGSLAFSLSLPALHINQYGLLVAVADGMGGHQGGSFASRIALENFARYFHENIQAGFGAEKVKPVIEAAISQTHHLLLKYGTENPQLADMATTIVGFCLRNENMLIYHAGDSRCYRFRNGFVMKLIEDHSLVQQMVNQGTITSEESEDHYQKNIITNCLGGGPDKSCQPEIKDESPQPGDIYLLCSDGLSNPLHHDEIEAILKADTPLHQKADRLIFEANERGGDDNITVLLCRVGNLD